jgi:hypothetical protein
MAPARHLFGMALKPVAEGACIHLGGEAAGGVAGKVAGFLAERFADQSKKINYILAEANNRAWRAVEVALAGESFWGKLAKAEDRALREQIRGFINALPPDQIPGDADGFRIKCLNELRAAKKQGFLAPGVMSPNDLSQEAARFARFDDPAKLQQAEFEALGRMGDEMAKAGYPNLGKMLAPRNGVSLLVVAARFFLRRAIEEDRELFQGLAFAKLEQLQQGQEEGFAAL